MRIMTLEAQQAHKLIYTIRRFEETALELFSQGKLNGTTHTCIGQEANSVGLISHLSQRDIVWSNHRCHGHYLSFTKDVRGLINELVGTAQGVCAGRGGSQHLCRGNFYSNGVLGSIVPVACGCALAEKFKKTDSIVLVFIGDGALGEGAIYESMNIASLWDLPILFVVENNFYAQTTPSYLQLAGKIADRSRAFGLSHFEITSNDVFEVYNYCKQPLDHVRQQRKPAVLVLNTYRLAPHSKGDDFRDPSEINEWKKKDPLIYTRAKASTDSLAKIEQEVDEMLLALTAEALKLGGVA